ncbi:MAG: HAD family hydrolase [Planctomycetota bacterium]|nr:HAD family hydrolase [Planctomycetota bacterium]
MPLYKAVYFDFGDTLAPSSPVPLPQRLRTAFQETDLHRRLSLALPDDDEALHCMHEESAAHAGWPVDPGWEEQYEKFYTVWAGILLKRLGAETAASAEAAPAFASAFRDVSDRSRTAYEDCVPMLDELKRMGLRLSIVSNNDGTLARRMQYMKLFDYFEVVADSALVRSNKPDAGIFKHVLDATGLQPREVLHVGDLYDADVEGSGAMGMDCAWINREHLPFPAAPKYRPRFVLRTLMELPALLADVPQYKREAKE